MEKQEHEVRVRKPNRQKAREAEQQRPVVHGTVPYLGHRPRPKHERKRVAELVREARKKA